MTSSSDALIKKCKALVRQAIKRAVIASKGKITGNNPCSGRPFPTYASLMKARAHGVRMYKRNNLSAFQYNSGHKGHKGHKKVTKAASPKKAVAKKAGAKKGGMKTRAKKSMSFWEDESENESEDESEDEYQKGGYSCQAGGGRSRRKFVDVDESEEEEEDDDDDEDEDEQQGGYWF